MAPVSYTHLVSLPSIVADSVFGLSGTQPAEDATLLSSYTEMAEAVSDVVDGAYDLSLSEVERIIADGGYDYDLSMDALINYAQSSAGYDVCYILAAYSASMEQQNTSQADKMCIRDRLIVVDWKRSFPFGKSAIRNSFVYPPSHYSSIFGYNMDERAICRTSRRLAP